MHVQARSVSVRPTALITGASSGIGYAMAWEAAKRGFDVVLVARRRERLERLAQEVHKQYQVSAHVFVYDLAQVDASEQIVRELAEKEITIDLLINNAGLGVFGPFWKTKWERERELMQVNMFALTELTHRILPGMVARKTGQILNVGSTAAFQPGPWMPLYYASKAFVLSFSEALATQLEGSGVSVTIVCPGPVRTEFAKRTGGDVHRARLFSHVYLEANEVARQAFEALERRQVLVIPGVTNKLGTIAARFFPRKAVRRLVQKGQEYMRGQ